MNYRLNPCDNCPFRTDVRPYIRSERAAEILGAPGNFHCHKTTVPDEDEDGFGVRRSDARSQVCAGFLIVLENDDAPNQMMRIAERLGLFDRTKLNMDAPVYESVRACIAAHRAEERRLRGKRSTRQEGARR